MNYRAQRVGHAAVVLSVGVMLAACGNTAQSVDSGVGAAPTTSKTTIDNTAPADPATASSLVEQSRNAPRVPVLDHSGTQRGFINRSDMKKGTDPKALADVPAVTNDSGEVVGYFLPAAGFVERSEAEAPGYDVAKVVADARAKADKTAKDAGAQPAQ